MTKEELFKLGEKAYKSIKKKDARFCDWNIFSRTLGFFQFQKKHNLTREDVEEFKRGFFVSQYV